MSYSFKLQLVRMECFAESLRESGKDEMRLLGFGVTRKGHVFTIGFTNLGSYNQGDVNKGAIFPATLLDRELEDDGLNVLFAIWLSEKDKGSLGNVASQNIESTFHDKYDEAAAELRRGHYPEDCIPFAAFSQCIRPLDVEIRKSATSGTPNDFVYNPYIFHAYYDSPNINHYSGKIAHAFAEGDQGAYQLSVEFSYNRVTITG